MTIEKSCQKILTSKKVQPYRKIFDMNNRHIKYANGF